MVQAARISVKRNIDFLNDLSNYSQPYCEGVKRAF